MDKSNGKKNFYSLDKILKYDVPYRIIIGERSNGKTYSVKKRCIDKFKMGEGKFIYLRRRHNQITKKGMLKLFDDMTDYCMENLNDSIHYSVMDGAFYIMDYEENRTNIGYVTSMEDMYNVKGIPFNEVSTIFFDEFLEYGSKMDDETALFLNMVSTIRRERENVEIFMVGNTITKFSVYFDLFGIDIKKIKPNNIYYFKHEAGVEGAIERTPSRHIEGKKKLTDRYLGFDNNPTSTMILYGEWEYITSNTKNVDGIGWESKRYLVPCYVTALQEVYEISLYLGDNPITFVRKLNTQNGEVRSWIKYNLSYDESIILTNKKGIVPRYCKVSKLMDSDTLKSLGIVKMCLDCHRVVYDTMSTGSDFERYFKTLL